MTNPIPTNPTSGVVAPVSKYTNFASQGDAVLAARRGAAMDVSGDEMSAYMANLAAGHIPMRVASQVAESVAGINAAVANGDPIVFTTTAGASLTAEEIAAIQAVRSGQLQLDPNGQPMGSGQLSAIEDTLERLERQFFPNRRTTGRSLTQRIEDIAALQAPTPVDTSAAERSAVQRALDVLGRAVGVTRVTSMTNDTYSTAIAQKFTEVAEDTRRETLAEFGNELNEPRGTRSLTDWKSKLVQKARDLVGQVNTLTTERNDARTGAVEFGAHLDEASLAVDQLTNTATPRRPGEPAINHIRRAYHAHVGQGQGQQPTPAPAARPAPPRQQQGQQTPAPGQAAPAPGTGQQPPSQPPSGGIVGSWQNRRRQP